MARRYNTRDFFEGAEKPTSGPVPLSGLIRPQPHYKKKTRLYRPLQLSDFGEDDNNNDGEDSDRDGVSSLADDFGRQMDLQPARPSHPTPNSMYGPGPAHRPVSPSHLPRFQWAPNMSPVLQPTMLPSQDETSKGVAFSNKPLSSEGVSPTDTGYGIVASYTRLFGKQLPDPYYLKAEAGTFDGEVVFIGHPNRDVSAHQWSQESYEWANIGLYSHNRRRVEGVLASERLRASSIPPNTVEYFKAVAEQRQRQHISRASPDNSRSAEPSTMQHSQSQHRPSLTELEHFASLSTVNGSTRSELPTLSSIRTLRGDSGRPETGTPRTVAVETLEDPFVTPAKNLQPNSGVKTGLAGGNSGEAGSMDFGYEFPTKPGVKHSMFPSQTSAQVHAQSSIFRQREQDRLEAMRRGISSQNYEAPSLRDVRFGEEACTEYEAQGVSNWENGPTLRLPASTEFGHRLNTRNKLYELDSPVMRSTQRVAVPNVPVSQGTQKTQAASQGLTVANPNPVASRLNAQAPPYTGSVVSRVEEESESEVTATNPLVAENLKFSDPDHMRPPQVHEIANGLSQQAPTPQNFKGPFFTDHMPTTLNPTATRAIQMDEREKLNDWFHDGQRPARQQEFCRTIMASAEAGAEARVARRFGAIGEPRVQHLNRFENTPIFVTLYENLYEYADESRVGRGRDYFTRWWN